MRLNFQFALFLGRLGFFRYDGAHAFAKSRGWPMARVFYHGVPSSWQWPPDSTEGYSVPMAIGNAVEYARMFNGTVVPLTERAT